MPTPKSLNTVKLSVANPIILLDTLKEMGFSSHVIFSGIHINAELFESANNQIDFEQYLELIQRAIELTNNPAIGLEFGARLSFTGHNNLGIGLVASQSFTELLQFTQRCAVVINPATEFTIHTDSSKLYLDMQEAHDWGENDVFMVDTAFSMFTTIANMFDPNISRSLIYDMKHPAPEDVSPYEQHLRGTLNFNSTRNRITFPILFCQRPLSLKNPSAVKQAENLLEQQLKIIGNDRQEMINIIKEMIKANPGHPPTLQDVSDTFHVSSRTLNRRFKAMGSNFKSFVNEVRKQLAIEHLTNRRLPIEEISFRLGFKDPSNFSKAFKSWTGLSPSQYSDAHPRRP